MADPRFYDNRGPFRLSEICRIAQIEYEQADASAVVHDVAALEYAGPQHVTFCERRQVGPEVATAAGWCVITRLPDNASAKSTRFLIAKSAARSFAAAAQMFYPEHEQEFPAQDAAVHASAKIGNRVAMAPGVVVGRDAEIGDDTKLGAHCIIGRGVAVGRGCKIGPHAVIGFAYLGDEVIVQPGVIIGASGFGFISGPDGHRKIPQLGRVIVQDRVEVGANTTIDRAALGDTVIGEGTKIDNLVQIGHNTRIGRHCVIAGQVGISGSVVLGDFVAVGGMAGIADHVTIGDRARLAGLTGVAHDLEPGRDYGGIPARPIREWHRQVAYLSRVTSKTKRPGHD
jgi:UDP-3-O-[3-hydroxymyristoyl] glucosamine N-acyltransferase